jgi:hypothetical protein
MPCQLQNEKKESFIKQYKELNKIANNFEKNGDYETGRLITEAMKKLSENGDSFLIVQNIKRAITLCNKNHYNDLVAILEYALELAQQKEIEIKVPQKEGKIWKN